MGREIKIRRRFSLAERTAIAEMVEAASLIVESDRNKPNDRMKSLAALIFEATANIIRGERGPRIYSNREVLEFARVWNVQERAKFNPPRRKRKSVK